jgi:hypothetical protein
MIVVFYYLLSVFERLCMRVLCEGGIVDVRCSDVIIQPLGHLNELLQ